MLLQVFIIVVCGLLACLAHDRLRLGHVWQSHAVAALGGCCLAILIKIAFLPHASWSILLFLGAAFGVASSISFLYSSLTSEEPLPSEDVRQTVGACER